MRQLIPTSPEAYRDYISGRNDFAKRDYPNAIKLYLQCVSRDSNFFLAIFGLSMAYGNQGSGIGDQAQAKNLFDEAKKWCRKLNEKRDQMPDYEQFYIDQLYAHLFETPEKAINACKQILEFDDQQPSCYYQLGDYYNWLYQYDKAIPEFEKALEIYNKWGIKPWWYRNYTALGLAYHKTGQYKKEKKLYKKAEQDFPDNPQSNLQGKLSWH